MASAAQIAANRQNALKSTGPRTATGKAASSGNAKKHGLHARELLTSDAADTEIRQIEAKYHQDFPHLAQRLLVRQLAEAEWRAAYAVRAEGETWIRLLAQLSAAGVDPRYATGEALDRGSSLFLKIYRFEARAWRDWHCAFHELAAQTEKFQIEANLEVTPDTVPAAKPSGSPSESSESPQTCSACKSEFPALPGAATPNTAPSPVPRQEPAPRPVCPELFAFR
jgi:hypothetical protein